jgi:hypothetical protein
MVGVRITALQLAAESTEGPEASRLLPILSLLSQNVRVHSAFNVYYIRYSLLARSRAIDNKHGFE